MRPTLFEFAGADQSFLLRLHAGTGAALVVGRTAAGDGVTGLPHS